jgi:hypothetical protein
MNTHFGYSIICVATLLVLVADPVTLSSASGCEEVTGRLLDLHVDGGVTVGQMIGSIEGDYEYTMGPGFDAGIPGLSIWFGTGTSILVTEEGSLFFAEASVMDTAEQVFSNIADLLTITGGTGKWLGASGHLILSGFFHTDTLTGEFDYQGEVCKGPVSHETESWGELKASFRD